MSHFHISVLQFPSQHKLNPDKNRFCHCFVQFSHIAKAVTRPETEKKRYTFRPAQKMWYRQRCQMALINQCPFLFVPTRSIKPSCFIFLILSDIVFLLIPSFSDIWVNVYPGSSDMQSRISFSFTDIPSTGLIQNKTKYLLILYVVDFN